MDNEKAAAIFEETFSGLVFFYRDANLSDELIAKYRQGHILIERGFTDMSCKGGGLMTNLRYLIASSKGKNLSGLNPASSKYGHFLLAANASFIVLDTYKIKEQTQVFLLHIPNHAIAFFQNHTSSVEADLIQKAREKFEEKLNLSPVAELQEEAWIQRTAFPLGMSEKGEMFFIETNVS